MGWQAIMVNSNPETVSTDFDASSRLYFESLDAESVLDVVRAETVVGQPPLGALVQFGGQTPLGLAATLDAGGVPLRGLDLEAIDQTEERVRFAGLVDRLGIPQPPGGMATSVEEALVVAERIGYPVIVRPSFVIGGLAVDFAYGPEDLAAQLAAAIAVDDERPVRHRRSISRAWRSTSTRSADGTEVLIPGSSSTSSAPASTPAIRSASTRRSAQRRRAGLVVETITRIALALGVRGLINGQFIVRDDGVYLLEVNPRAAAPCRS